MGLTLRGGGSGGGGTALTSYATQVAALPDYPTTFPSSDEVSIVVYSGSVGTTRPGAEFVVWQGFPTQPTNMADGDLWLSDTGGVILSGSGAPTSGDGANGDFWIRTSNSTLYGPKASGAWGSGVSLVGTSGTNGRGVTSIARTSGTGAAGTTDTYTITYSDATTSTFTVVNGADGAGASNLTPTAKTTAYTAVANDFVLGDASGGAFIVTLPTPTSGVRIGIKKTDSSTNALTVATTSGTIDGASTRTLPVQNAAQVYVGDGTNWFRIDVPAVTAIAATGTPSSTTYLRGDGSWSTPAGGGTATDYRLPSGAIAATHDRTASPMGALAPTSGLLYVSAINLYAGQVVTSISVRSATTAWGTVTHSWAVLADSSRSVLAVSADDTTASLTANTNKAFTMGTPYTVPTSGLYYVGVMIAASTLSFTGPSGFGTQQLTIPPITGGSSNSSQTTPVSVGATLTTITPAATHPFLWVS